MVQKSLINQVIVLHDVCMWLNAHRGIYMAMSHHEIVHCRCTRYQVVPGLIIFGLQHMIAVVQGTIYVPPTKLTNNRIILFYGTYRLNPSSQNSYLVVRLACMSVRRVLPYKEWCYEFGKGGGVVFGPVVFGRSEPLTYRSDAFYDRLW